MGNKIFDDKAMVQVGIVVRDIEKTSAAYAKAFGIEKPSWSSTDSYDKARTEYRGKPSTARSKLAFMRFGSLDIELIEPDEGPSTWREFLDERGDGVHHVAFIIDGMKDHIARAEAAGMALLQKGEYTGGRYAISTLRPISKSSSSSWRTINRVAPTRSGEFHRFLTITSREYRQAASSIWMHKQSREESHGSEDSGCPGRRRHRKPAR